MKETFGQLLTYTCNNNTEYVKFRKNNHDLKDYYDNQQKGVLNGLIFGDEELKLALNEYFVGDEILRDEMFEMVKQRKTRTSTDDKEVIAIASDDEEDEDQNKDEDEKKDKMKSVEGHNGNTTMDRVIEMVTMNDNSYDDDQEKGINNKRIGI